MKNLLIIPLLLICISCASTKYIDRPVPVEVVRTEYINQVYKDSIYVHDSIDRYISGDTVYQYKYKYVYKYLNKTDTIIVTDSIEVPTEIKTTEIKEVNKLKWYQTTLMWVGGLTLLILGIILGKKVKTFI